MAEWYNDLCEYYKVTPEQAVKLGTRSPGRKPNLPGSPTCQPVSGMTFEELWDAKPRETIQQKMDFYKDIGAWQVFRQSNYNKDIGIRYSAMFKQIPQEGTICEYGCGIAPISRVVAEKREGDLSRLQIHLVDVPGEHLAFASFCMRKLMKCGSINFHEVSEQKPVPDFGETVFDMVMVMDVLEHVPNPLLVIENITEHIKEGGILVENWIRGHNADRENLKEAEKERDFCMEYINVNYIKTFKEGYRIWRKCAPDCVPS